MSRPLTCNCYENVFISTLSSLYARPRYTIAAQWHGNAKCDFRPLSIARKHHVHVRAALLVEIRLRRSAFIKQHASCAARAPHWNSTRSSLHFVAGDRLWWGVFVRLQKLLSQKAACKTGSTFESTWAFLHLTVDLRLVQRLSGQLKRARSCNSRNMLQSDITTYDGVYGGYLKASTMLFSCLFSAYQVINSTKQCQFVECVFWEA